MITAGLLPQKARKHGGLVVRPVLLTNSVARRVRMSPHAIVVSNTFLEEGRLSSPPPQNAAITDCCLSRLGSELLLPQRPCLCPARYLPLPNCLVSPAMRGARCEGLFSYSRRQSHQQPLPSSISRSRVRYLMARKSGYASSYSPTWCGACHSLLCHILGMHSTLKPFLNLPRQFALTPRTARLDSIEVYKSLR